MKNKIFFLICLMSFGVGPAIGRSILTAPQGKLVFGRGQGLYTIDLPSCQTKQIYRDNLSMFSKVSKVDSRRFLFLQDGPKELDIRMFDLGSKSSRVILKNGYSPYYNTEHKTILYNYTPNYKEGPYLYIGSLEASTVTKIKKITRSSSDVNDIGVIPVSNDEVVFNYQNSSEHIMLYNIVTNKLKTLPIKNCDYPKIWRSATKQLMCYNPRSAQYFLTDLLGERVEKIKIKSGFSPVLYLPEHDELLYTTTYFGFFPKLDPETGRLSIYNFSTGQSKILCSDVNLGTGDAAYYE